MKKYTENYAYTDLKINGILKENKEYAAKVEVMIPVEDTELSGDPEFNIQITNNKTGIEDDKLKEIIEISIEKHHEYDMLNDGSNWETSIEADEDINGYVVSFSFGVKNLEIDIDEEETSEAINILKKIEKSRKVKKSATNKTIKKANM